MTDDIAAEADDLMKHWYTHPIAKELRDEVVRLRAEVQDRDDALSDVRSAVRDLRADLAEARDVVDELTDVLYVGSDEIVDAVRRLRAERTKARNVIDQVRVLARGGGNPPVLASSDWNAGWDDAMSHLLAILDEAEEEQ